MKQLKMPAAVDMHPNVTPLIDVVMCLIIFYMLVAKIGVSTGAERRIELPKSVQGNKLLDPGNTITLNIIKGPRNEPFVTAMDPAKGGARLEEFPLLDASGKPLLKFLKRVRGQNNEFKAVIRADQNLDYSYIEPVLICCTEAQVKSINFATRQEEQVITKGR